MISYQLPLGKLVNADHSLNEQEAELVGFHLDWAAANNMSIVLHVSHYMPEWATSKHPDLVMSGADENDGQHGVHYDIDHPIARAVLQAGLGGLASALGCRLNLVGWELANEPAFRRTASLHTKAAFTSWLSTRYSDRIVALQQRWAERHTDFAAAADSGWQLQGRLDSSRQPALGTSDVSKLADWARFNDGRVLRWTSLMVDAIKAGGSRESGAEQQPEHAGELRGREPQAKPQQCHRTFMRLNNALLLNARLADHGMDRSALAARMDVHGFDSNFGFASESGQSSAFDSPVESYDTRRYCIDWLNYYGSLTLLRSFDETKPLFDSEMHLSSATKWRKNVVDDAGARAARPRTRV